MNADTAPDADDAHPPHADPPGENIDITNNNIMNTNNMNNSHTSMNRNNMNSRSLLPQLTVAHMNANGGGNAKLSLILSDSMEKNVDIVCVVEVGKVEWPALNHDIRAYPDLEEIERRKQMKIGNDGGVDPMIPGWSCIVHTEGQGKGGQAIFARRRPGWDVRDATSSVIPDREPRVCAVRVASSLVDHAAVTVVSYYWYSGADHDSEKMNQTLTLISKLDLNRPVLLVGDSNSARHALDRAPTQVLRDTRLWSHALIATLTDVHELLHGGAQDVGEFYTRHQCNDGGHTDVRQCIAAANSDTPIDRARRCTAARIDHHLLNREALLVIFPFQQETYTPDQVTSDHRAILTRFRVINATRLHDLDNVTTREPRYVADYGRLQRVFPRQANALAHALEERLLALERVPDAALRLRRDDLDGAWKALSDAVNEAAMEALEGRRRRDGIPAHRAHPTQATKAQIWASRLNEVHRQIARIRTNWHGSGTWEPPMRVLSTLIQDSDQDWLRQTLRQLADSLNAARTRPATQVQRATDTIRLQTRCRLIARRCLTREARARVQAAQTFREELFHEHRAWGAWFAKVTWTPDRFVATRWTTAQTGSIRDGIDRLYQEQASTFRADPRPDGQPGITFTLLFEQMRDTGAELDIPDVTADEVRAALKGQTWRRATDDGIANAAWAACSQEVLTVLAALCTRALKTGDMPTPWRESTTVLIPKGDGRFRPICLLASGYRVLSLVLLARARRWQAVTGHCHHAAQSGFADGRSCHETLLATRAMAEYASQQGKTMHVLLVDATNAFCRVTHEALWEGMQVMPPALRFQFLACMAGLRSRAAVGHGVYTLWWNVDRGVQQGAVYSPFLFNLVMDKALTHVWSFAHQRGLGCLLLNSRLRVPAEAYADDLKLIAEKNAHLQDLAECARDFLEPRGIRWNETKTKYVQLGQVSAGDAENPDSVHLGGVIVERSQSARDLGVIVGARIVAYEGIETRFNASLEHLRRRRLDLEEVGFITTVWVQARVLYQLVGAYGEPGATSLVKRLDTQTRSFLRDKSWLGCSQGNAPLLIGAGVHPLSQRVASAFLSLVQHVLHLPLCRPTQTESRTGKVTGSLAATALRLLWPTRAVPGQTTIQRGILEAQETLQVSIRLLDDSGCAQPLIHSNRDTAAAHLRAQGLPLVRDHVAVYVNPRPGTSASKLVVGRVLKIHQQWAAVNLLVQERYAHEIPPEGPDAPVLPDLDDVNTDEQWRELTQSATTLRYTTEALDQGRTCWAVQVFELEQLHRLAHEVRNEPVLDDEMNPDTAYSLTHAFDKPSRAVWADSLTRHVMEPNQGYTHTDEPLNRVEHRALETASTCEETQSSLLLLPRASDDYTDAGRYTRMATALQRLVSAARPRSERVPQVMLRNDAGDVAQQLGPLVYERMQFGDVVLSHQEDPPRARWMNKAQEKLVPCEIGYLSHAELLELGRLAALRVLDVGRREATAQNTPIEVFTDASVKDDVASVGLYCELIAPRCVGARLVKFTAAYGTMRPELIGIILAILVMPHDIPILIKCDNESAIKVTKRCIAKKARHETPTDSTLISLLCLALAARSAQTDVEWVKGHDHIYGNEQADMAAGRARLVESEDPIDPDALATSAPAAVWRTVRRDNAAAPALWLEHDGKIVRMELNKAASTIGKIERIRAWSSLERSGALLRKYPHLTHIAPPTLTTPPAAPTDGDEDDGEEDRGPGKKPPTLIQLLRGKQDFVEVDGKLMRITARMRLMLLTANLPTMSVLQSHASTPAEYKFLRDKCPRCDALETPRHAIWTCPAVREIWQHIFPPHDDGQEPYDLGGGVDWWVCATDKKDRSFALQNCVTAWKKRNATLREKIRERNDANRARET